MPLCTPYPSLSKTDISIKKPLSILNHPSFTETNAINGYNLAPSTVIENERFIFEGVVYNPSKKVREIMAAGIGAILNRLPVADNKSAL